MTAINTVASSRPALFVVPVPAALAEAAAAWFARHGSPNTALLGVDEAWFMDAADADAFAEVLGQGWIDAT